MANQCTIECNSNLITIGQALQDALASIWQIQPSNCIWADALCIFQADLAEKSAQVAMMHCIFAQAAHVLVCLGPRFDRSTKVMQCMRSLAGTRAASRDLPSPSDSKVQRTEALIELQALLQPMGRLVSHPWFTRMGTFQEIAVILNAQVICGHEWLPWSTFYSAVMLLSESISYNKHATRREKQQGSILSHHLKDLDEALNITRLPGTRLQQLLIATRHCRASDDRDRVFALLNIVKGEDKSAVLIDYAASIKDVFTKTTVSSIQSARSLNVLRMAGLQVRKISSLENRNGHPELPPWVPNWLDAGLLDEFPATQQHRRDFCGEDPIEEEKEESGRDFAYSVTNSILQCRGRMSAILLLSPTQNTAALYPVQGSLYSTFACLVVMSVIHATSTHSLALDPSTCKPKWRCVVGRNRVELQHYVGTRIEWENGDVVVSLEGSGDLYLLRAANPEHGRLGLDGTYLQLVAVLDACSMEEFNLDIAECVSDECAFNIC